MISKNQKPNNRPKQFGRPSSGGFQGRKQFSRPSFKGRSSTPRKRSARTSAINESLFINKAKDVVVEVYTPTHTFADFGFDARLTANLSKKGYVTPSPIQDQAIPVLLKGNDVIGIANTGTGKTATFLLPIITELLKDKKHKAIILAPTRELALQIEKEFRNFTEGMRLYSISCVGGAPIGKQVRELERGVSVVIGTPGRISDLIRRGTLKMADYKTIVLDEADRMLDMGFIDEIRRILSLMDTDKQGLFFSATMPAPIKILCDTFLENPVMVSVKTRDTASGIDQDIVRARPNEKIDALHDILINPECKKVLIFREMKRHTDQLADELRARGFKVSALHGDMRNRERERAVSMLTTGGIQALIATDVAARGIDIPDITHVINFDTPRDYETYIHRVGRTGRGSSKGNALTFVGR